MSASNSPYGSAFWKRRSLEFLERNPLCRHCLARGRVEAARVSDHIDGWQDLEAFKTGPLQPLCLACHASKTAEDKRLAEAKKKTQIHWL